MLPAGCSSCTDNNASLCLLVAVTIAPYGTACTDKQYQPYRVPGAAIVPSGGRHDRRTAPSGIPAGQETERVYRPPRTRRKVARHGRTRRSRGGPQHAPPPALVAVAVRGLRRAVPVQPVAARARRGHPVRRPRGGRVVPEVLREAGPAGRTDAGRRRPRSG